MGERRIRTSDHRFIRRNFRATFWESNIYIMELNAINDIHSQANNTKPTAIAYDKFIFIVLVGYFLLYEVVNLII